MNSCQELPERFAAISDLQAGFGHRPEREWLSAPELVVWHSLEGRPGATGWLAGRWLAKTLVAEVGGASDGGGADFRDLAILSTDASGRRNRPQIFLRGQSLRLRLSLAHSERYVYATVGSGSAGFGVDVAEAADLKTSFTVAWFTPSERKFLDAAPDRAAGLRIWTAKEASYKACQSGESFDPRRCEVRPGDAHSGYTTYHGPIPRRCQVRWVDFGVGVRALAVREDESE